MSSDSRILITLTIINCSTQGAPYRKTFDGVIAHCLQAGLIDKWLRDLYSIYQNEVQEKKTPQEKKEELFEAAERRSDGMVRGLRYSES